MPGLGVLYVAHLRVGKMEKLGQFCWTLRGIMNFFFSLLLALIKDLIKIVTLLSAHEGVVEVVGFKVPAPGAEDFRIDNGPGELLQGHTVVGEKARHACRGRTEYAEPACGLLAENGAQPQVDTYGDQDGQGRAQKLPDGQAEEYRFLVAADFFRDFYFYKLPLLFLSQLGTYLYR